MLSQTFPTIRDTLGASVATLSRALASFPYRAVQSLDIVDPKERREFGALVRERELWLDFCASRALGNEKLALSAADSDDRTRAVDLVLEMVTQAIEQGARYLSMSSGTGHLPGGGERGRVAAIERFAQSLEMIRDAIADANDGDRPGARLGMLIEPMDVAVHKRGSLGYADESIGLIRSLQSDRCDVRLICDTAHLRLNSESVMDLMPEASELVAALHLCNCCVDPDHELYGDHHIKPGPPGEFNVADYRALLGEIKEAITPSTADVAAATSHGTESALPVFVEYRNYGDVGAHLSYLAETWRHLGFGK